MLVLSDAIGKLCMGYQMTKGIPDGEISILPDVAPRNGRFEQQFGLVERPKRSHAPHIGYM